MSFLHVLNLALALIHFTLAGYFAHVFVFNIRSMGGIRRAWAAHEDRAAFLIFLIVPILSVLTAVELLR
jgi:hypothetical protein